MYCASRAKQFIPFDALKGLRDALREKERILVTRRDAPEEQRDELNERLGLAVPFAGGRCRRSNWGLNSNN